MLLNYIIVDSKAFDRLHLTQLLKNSDDLELRAEFSNAVEALNYLDYNTVDLIFLASRLPIYSGFEFVEKLKDETQIILMTNDPQDAFKAFEYGLFDCISVPLDLDRIEKTIERFKLNFQKKHIPSTKEQNHLIIKHNLKNEKIEVDDIDYIEATGDYVKLVTPQKNYIILSTMKGMMNRLPQNQFLRVHKSYIVNLKKVSHYTNKIVMIANKEIPLSRNHKKEFQLSYEQF